MTEYIYGWEPCEKIPEMKMVQREEIVRCVDCKHYKVVDDIWDGECETEIYGCTKFDMLDGSDPFGFCKWGERE